MIVLDTNVVSEVLKPHPDVRVVAWLEPLVGDVAMTSATYAELLTGIALLPEGRRRRQISLQVNAVLQSYRDCGAVLPFDEEAGFEYTKVVAARGRAGSPINTADAQIVAICRAHRATCATHNFADFVGMGIELVNPWLD